jgi:hypothetical protein
MRIARLLLLLALAPFDAAAQPRPFTCIGAEALEDDVFAVPFARGSDRLTAAATNALDAAEALAKEMSDRNICVLGHADRGQGAQTSIQLAAIATSACSAMPTAGRARRPPSNSRRSGRGQCPRRWRNGASSATASGRRRGSAPIVAARRNRARAPSRSW